MYNNGLSTILNPIPGPTNFERAGLSNLMLPQYQVLPLAPKKYAYTGSKIVANPVGPSYVDMDPATSSGPYREPTHNNPMMNYNVTAYDKPESYSDYNRYQKYNDASAIRTRSEVANKLTGSLHQSPADFLFHKDASERQFYSVPVGGNTPDTVEFAENLYGIKNNCKMGSIYQNRGLLYTDDSLMCTPGRASATPTGFGSIR